MCQGTDLLPLLIYERSKNQVYVIGHHDGGVEVNAFVVLMET